MGVRIPKARLQKDPGRLVEATKYAKHLGPVLCLHCPASLSAVPEYTRLVNGKQVYVSAYFRLHLGIEHDTSCVYNIDATLQRLVSRSREVTDLGSEFIALLEKTQSGATVRLHVLTRHVLPALADPTTGTVYQTTQRVLDRYIRDTRALIQILACPELRRC